MIFKGKRKIKMKDYNRNIIMLCPICGNDQFSNLDNEEDLQTAPDETRIQCSDCKKILTKTELIESNQHIIEANIEEVKNDFIKDLDKQLKKMFN